MPRLSIRRDGVIEAEVDLTGQIVRIGRSADNDVVLDEPTRAVSRHHAELRFRDGKYVLVDLNSQNGTWIGGHSIREVAFRPEEPALIGPYTLALSGAAAPARDDRRPSIASGASRDDRRPSAASAPAREDRRPPPAPDPRAARPRPRAVATTASPQGAGPIAWLARQPKPLLLGGFVLFMVLLLTVLNLLSPAPPKPGAPAGTAKSNDEVVAALLAEGTALLNKGEDEAALAQFERALILKPDHPQALDLKLRAQERLRTAAPPRPAAPK